LGETVSSRKLIVQGHGLHASVWSFGGQMMSLSCANKTAVQVSAIGTDWVHSSVIVAIKQTATHLMRNLMHISLKKMFSLDFFAVLRSWLDILGL
jgi:hypothetical protein